MPTSAEIVALLSLQKLGGDIFVGQQPHSSTLEKVYGGQLFGQAVVAARVTVEDPFRTAHSLQAYFLDAGRHGSPVHYHVDRLRDGRSFSARSVLAIQDGRPLLRLMASFHVPEPGLSHAEPMPTVAPPDKLPSIQDVIRDRSTLPDEPWRREWDGLDIRYVPDNLANIRLHRPGRQQIWIRVCDPLPDDPALHREVLTYLSDIGLLNTALVPHGMVMGAPELPRATLNHSVWLHAPARPDTWLLIDQRSPRAVGARALSFAEVFTAEGRHVASFAQEGLIRPRGALRQQLELCAATVDGQTLNGDGVLSSGDVTATGGQ
ncbi:MAG: acyl-CoA thioesterase II [Hyphomicrobiales bacterium]|nr:MAG: acyl-CoA thioesterase II [Hyphomicrobiales bacterium]